MYSGNMPRRELSYPCDFIAWDGRKLSLIDEDTVAAKLQQLKAIGVNMIMTGGIQFLETADFEMAAGVERFAAQLAAAEVTVSSIHLVQQCLAPCGVSQHQVRAIMERTIAACAPLQPRTLVIHAGMKLTLGSVEDDFAFFRRETERVGIDAIIATAADNLRHMARIAAGCGINLAVENLGRFEPLGDFDTLPKLVASVDEKNFGYCVDSGHAHAFGQPVSQWLKQAGGKLYETHFHDNHGGLANWNGSADFIKSTPAVDEHLPPGFGTIDWREVIRTLDEIGFPGPVGFESGGWPGEDQAEGLQLAVNWWRCAERLARNT